MRTMKTLIFHEKNMDDYVLRCEETGELFRVSGKTIAALPAPEEAPDLVAVALYMSALLKLELDRPLSQEEEAKRAGELDVLWDQLSKAGQDEVEKRLRSVEAPESLRLVDRDPHGQVPYIEE